MTDFFSAIAPALYDLSLPAVVPGLEEARRLRASIWRSVFGVENRWTGADLGIGTGSDAASLLPQDCVGTLYGFDGSKNLTHGLLDAHRLPGGEHRSLEVCILPTDLGVRDQHPDVCCDFVNSAFAFHNIHRTAQANAFDLVGKLLRPGGIFFYLDLVGYDDLQMEIFAHNFDLAFIRAEMAKVPEGVDVGAWYKLRDRWIEHYEEENFLIPLTSKAEEPDLQRLYKNAGLSPPTVVFRLLHTTLIVAAKM